MTVTCYSMYHIFFNHCSQDSINTLHIIHWKGHTCSCMIIPHRKAISVEGSGLGLEDEI